MNELAFYFPSNQQDSARATRATGWPLLTPTHNYRMSEAAKKASVPVNVQDITGRTFGRLRVVQFARCDQHGNSWWECECSCGNRRATTGTRLRHGHTQSCGCLRNERTRAAKTTHGLSSGINRAKEYGVWVSIKVRIYNPRSKYYDKYGGRGISMCPQWRESFTSFLRDMGPRPSDRHSIERVDVNGDYCPSNCVWALPVTQQNNRRNNTRVLFRGETKNLGQWARHFGIKPSTLCQRLKHGWTMERALTEEVKCPTN